MSSGLTTASQSRCGCGATDDERAEREARLRDLDLLLREISTDAAAVDELADEEEAGRIPEQP